MKINILKITMLIFLSACGLKEESLKDKSAQVISSPSTVLEKPFVRRDVRHEQMVRKEMFLQYANKRWIEKIENNLKSKNISSFETYKKLKAQKMNEMMVLLKGKKLNKSAAFDLHLKYQLLLKEALGVPLYNQYLLQLKEENISNHKNGISVTIYI